MELAFQPGDTIILELTTFSGTSIGGTVTADVSFNSTAVAQINGVKYDSLREAIEAAVDGDIIVLLNNISVSETDCVQLDDQYNTLFMVENKRITVDLNGKTIYADATLMGKGSHITKTEDGFGTMIDWTGVLLDNMLVGVFSTYNNGHLTLVDSSEAKTGTVKAQAYNEQTGKCGIVYALLVNYENDCSITVNGGNYELDIARDCLVYSGCSHGENEGIVVNDGTFRLGNVGLGRNQSPWIFNVKGQNHGHVHINGGSFNSDIRNQYWIFESQVAGDRALVYNEQTGMYTVVDAKYTVNEQYRSGQWYTYDKGYVTLDEAVAAAQKNAAKAAAGKTLQITMLADDAGAGAVIGCDLIIDFGDHTYTLTEGIGFQIQEGCTLIRKNGIDALIKAAAKIERADGTYYYATYQQALDAAQEGETVIALN